MSKKSLPHQLWVQESLSSGFALILQSTAVLTGSLLNSPKQQRGDQRSTWGGGGTGGFVHYVDVQRQVHGSPKTLVSKIMPAPFPTRSCPGRNHVLPISRSPARLIHFSHPTPPGQLWEAPHLSSFRRATSAKVYSFLQSECKWHICPWFVIIFLTSDTEVHFVLNSNTPWTKHIQYDNLCNVI